ncbi:MAG: hypothetical protein AB8F95_07550 [Bacteroidia bacterium]
MKKYLALYHAPAALLGQMANATPEQKAEGMKPWLNWKAQSGESIVDFGAPLGGGQHINAGQTWGESQKEVSGYSIVQGENREAVQALFVDHPHLAWGEGCTIEIHEYLPM